MGRKAIHVLKATDVNVRKAIKNAKTAGSEQTWSVEGHPLLRLRARPTGVGTWYAYYLVHRKERRLKLGTYPGMTLKAACKRALEVQNDVEDGADPFLAKATIKASVSFKELAEDFLTNGGLAASTVGSYTDIYRRDAYPLFGHKPAVAVTADDIFAMCRAIKKRGADRGAQLAKTVVGGAFRYGIKNGYVKTNPTREVPYQQETESVRDRVPTDEEIAALWHGIGSKRRSEGVKLIVRLAILTGQRRTEVAGARLAEVSNGVWTIPAVNKKRKGSGNDTGRRMKNGAEQRVYLSTQAEALFDEALKTCSDGVWFFPSHGVRGKPDKTPRRPHIHGDSITQAVGSLGVKDVTIHDVRSAITTFLGERDDISGRTLDMITHHKRADDRTEDGITAVTRKHYNRARREVQGRHAWQVWADHVEDIVAKNAPSGIADETEASSVPAAETSPI
jgi:integrase